MDTNVKYFIRCITFLEQDNDWVRLISLNKEVIVTDPLLKMSKRDVEVVFATSIKAEINTNSEQTDWQIKKYISEEIAERLLHLESEKEFSAVVLDLVHICVKFFSGEIQANF